MLRKLSRMSLVLVVLLSSEVWGLGLGEIRLDSALNEPLRAEIELLSATPEELANLKITLAAPETFERYGIDRPAFLQGIQFRIVPSGRTDGNLIQVRSAEPITEPFLTFLVEAAWARGRLLREYTVLLDPPTFAPPAAAQSTPAVTAPTRTPPADSGRVERPAPAAPEPAAQPAPIQRPRTSQPQPQPQPQPATPAPAPAPVDDSRADTPYDTAAGGDVYVQRGDTLWGITQRVRPDSRLTINQTMLAIFEANPEAFGGNINVLRAGTSLRVPSADQVFQISRGDAISEVQRQNAAWTGGAPSIPAPADTTTRPNLQLVPPDDDFVAAGPGDEPAAIDEPLTREQEIEERITELEAADVPIQQSLIEIRNNELAALRQELAEIRGEVYEPPVEDVEPDTGLDTAAEDDLVDDTGTDDIVADEGETVADEADAAADEEEAAEPAPPPAQPAARRVSEPSIVDQALGLLTNFWTILVAALVVVGGVLFWFMRRGRDEDDDVEAWAPLDDDGEPADLAATESLRAPTPSDESFVVVEQGTGEQPILDDTFEAPAPPVVETDTGEDTREATGQFGSLEDTFSSDTAVNLDQSDPIAEADFHMAYGLYDQAADLVNGALQVEPERQDLLTKLCEIYFVWGNRDSFVDAATRLKAATGDGASADWDKIVIMGQQIAADNELFAGAAVAGATKAVDLSFDGGDDETGALDMELVADGTGENEVFDIGSADDETASASDMADLDFDFETGETQATPALDLDSTAEAGAFAEADDSTAVDLDLTEEAAAADEEPDFNLTAEMPELDDGTAEMPAPDDQTAEMPAPDPTVETPTIEEQFANIGATSELPSLEETGAQAGPSGDSTAEINLDDLGLDVSGLEETELASLDDLDAGDDTGINRELEGFAEATGKNPEVDPNATGVQQVISADATGVNEALDPEATEIATDAEFDDSLLDATGVTQVLSSDEAVQTGTDVRAGLGDDDATMLAPGYGDTEETSALGDDQETLLASLDDDDDGESDYDFAKTEALPADVFTGNASLDETGELPAVASTDMDLDLDDLTAALQVSDAGDTVEQLRDDETIEQPRPGISDGDDDSAATMSLGPEDMNEDLHEARTMTEVGTKLDLARAYVDMGDPSGARSILEEVLDEGDEGQRQQAQQLLDSLPS